MGKMNGAGADLLSFCALNELTIMNTYLEKKEIHKFTWQHPGSIVSTISSCGRGRDGGAVILR